MFLLVLIAPITGHTSEKSMALSPLLLQIPPSLPFSRMNSLSSPVCKTHLSLHHLSGPLLDLLQYIHVSVTLGSQGLDPAIQMWSYQCWVERKDHLLWPAGNAFPKAAQLRKTMEFSCIVEVKTALTGFRNRTWASHCLIYCISKPIIYTTVCFQNHAKVVGCFKKVKNS